MSYGWKLYGKIGLLIIAAVQGLLFLGIKPFTIYFTPLIWTGYILLIDSIIHRLKGESLISKHLGKFLVMLALSIGFWYIFEFYNLFIKNWQYVGLPESKFWRYLGYFWSFATIWPGILLTQQLLEALNLFKMTNRKSSGRLSPAFMKISVLIGTALLLWPIILPSPYLAGPVWLGFFLLLDPINYLWGERSILGDWISGKRETLYTLFLSGLFCGILWEFWNFWAEAKWKYTVPIWPDWKIFEMPIIGYLGFLPFACEVYSMYNFALGVWHKLKKTSGVGIVESCHGAII